MFTMLSQPFISTSTSEPNNLSASHREPFTSIKSLGHILSYRKVSTVSTVLISKLTKLSQPFGPKLKYRLRSKSRSTSIPLIISISPGHKLTSIIKVSGSIYDKSTVTILSQPSGVVKIEVPFRLLTSYISPAITNTSSGQNRLNMFDSIGVLKSISISTIQ